MPKALATVSKTWSQELAQMGVHKRAGTSPGIASVPGLVKYV